MKFGECNALVTDAKLGLVALCPETLVNAQCLTPNQSPGVPQHTGYNNYHIDKNSRKQKRQKNLNCEEVCAHSNCEPAHYLMNFLQRQHQDRDFENGSPFSNLISS